MKKKIIEPFNIVVFGGNSDLAFRKIYPALYQRFIDNQLNCNFNIYAVIRKRISDSEFRLNIEKFISSSSKNDIDNNQIEEFFKKISLTENFH